MAARVMQMVVGFRFFRFSFFVVVCFAFVFVVVAVFNIFSFVGGSLYIINWMREEKKIIQGGADFN